MQRLFIFLYLFVCIFTNNSLTAIVLEDQQYAENDLRILELLPNLVYPLAVDPCIPPDFIALSPRGTLDPYDWIYWGPKDVLKTYFENPASLKEPILRVKLSADVAQTGPKSFSVDSSLNPFESQWGDYPVLGARARIEGYLIFIALVGLNDPEGGSTVMFNLVYPEGEDPNDEAQQLWENLLTKTTQLKDGDYFKALGQDLQEGYTLVDIGGAKLQVLAEKRQSDGVLQVVVIPDSSAVEFHYEDMMECLMGAQWKYGEPMVKVYGEIVVTRGNGKCIITDVISIFFKTVPEFTFKKDDGTKFLIFQKISDKFQKISDKID